MGTRLYPNTKNPATLEKLAGVPAGTFKLYQELEDERKQFKDELQSRFDQGHDRDELFRSNENFEEKMWNRKQENPDVSRLDHFIMYGWGKIQFEGGCSGEHTDLYHVDQVLFWQGVGSDELNGVTLEELEGVYWC